MKQPAACIDCRDCCNWLKGNGYYLLGVVEGNEPEPISKEEEEFFGVIIEQLRREKKLEELFTRGFVRIEHHYVFITEGNFPGKKRGRYLMVTMPTKCPYLSSNINPEVRAYCTIYDRRPGLCRLYECAALKRNRKISELNPWFDEVFNVAYSLVRGEIEDWGHRKARIWSEGIHDFILNLELTRYRKVPPESIKDSYLSSLSENCPSCSFSSSLLDLFKQYKALS